MKNNSLKVNQNKDGSFTLEWDKQDSNWKWLNNLTTEEIGSRIFNTFLAVASGQKTKSEAQGLGDYEFVPWQIGAVM